MKKLVSVLVALVLAVSVFCCASAEDILAGGWALHADGAMTEEAQAAFDKAIGDDEHAKAVALLGTQVVAGINYSILTFNDYGAESYFNVLTIYADLEGNAVVNGARNIEIGAWGDDTDEPDDEVVGDTDEMTDGQNPVMNFIGDYQDKVSQRATMHIECIGADEGLLTIEWADSASEGYEWTFYCNFDAESGIFTAYEGIMIPYTADENGEITYGEAVTGLLDTFTVQEDDTIAWEGTGPDADNGCIFEFCYEGPQE